MAPTPGTRSSTGPGGSSALEAVRLIGFIAVAGMALTILAAVVILPAYRQRSLAWADRHRLAQQARLNERLIDYNERLIEAIKTDPVLTQKLLMEQQNYRRPSQRAIPIAEAPLDPSVPRLLAAQVAQSAQPPPAPSQRLDQLAQRVQDPATRRGLLLLAGLLISAAMIFLGRRSA